MAETEVHSEVETVTVQAEQVISEIEDDTSQNMEATAQADEDSVNVDMNAQGKGGEVMTRLEELED